MIDPPNRLSSTWMREPAPATAWNDCPCRILMETLGPNETLPNHVCAATAYFTVVDQRERDHHLSVLEDDRTLLLAIRRRVESKDDQTLANLLADSTEWNGLVETYQRIRQEDPGEIFWRFGMAPAREKILDELRLSGLPATPSMVRYLYAHVMDGTVVNGEPVNCNDARPPAYGGLITVYVWSSGPEIMTHTSLDLARGELFDAMSKSAREIRDWLVAIGEGTNPLADKAAIRRAAVRQGSLNYFPIDAAERSANDAFFNYETEALAEKNVAKLVPIVGRHLDGPQGAVSEYIENIYKRVSERRRKAGIPRQRPGDKGWRDNVRAQLLTLIATHRE